MHKIDSFKHSWLFHEKEFSPPFEWSGKLSWSHFRFTDMGIITQKSGSIVSSQPWTSSQWIDVFTNTPLIFLKLSHTLIACILSLCIFFPLLCPLFPPTPNTKWKEEESEAAKDVGHWGRESPEREWTQVSGIRWRLEDSKRVALVIPWLQGHVCPDIRTLLANQKGLMRMSFCTYLNAERRYVFKYIMLRFILLAYKKWSRHKEILVISISPETLDHIQFFSPKISSAPLLCFLIFFFFLIFKTLPWTS